MLVVEDLAVVDVKNLARGDEFLAAEALAEVASFGWLRPRLVAAMPAVR